MRKNNCEVIRRELDELMLEDSYSPSATEHLKQCVDCREFEQKQTKLRQIVGSLGTIEAPADFDFRLRARLASDSSNGSSFNWAFARRGFAVAAVLIVFAAGVVLVRNIMNPQRPVEVAAENTPPAPQTSPKPVETTAPNPEVNPKDLSAGAVENGPQKIRNERPSPAGSKSKRPIATVDFSSQRAEVVTGLEPSSAAAVFPIDASLQSLRVSLDDGQGNARTISVPTIRFGSQRMLPNGNSFAQKGVW